MSELQRIVRHGIAPLVAYAVAEGWLPEAMQEGVTEWLVMSAAILGPLAWSWWRERNS